MHLMQTFALFYMLIISLLCEFKNAIGLYGLGETVSLQTIKKRTRPLYHKP
jgi:hypothetical protein